LRQLTTAFPQPMPSLRPATQVTPQGYRYSLYISVQELGTGGDLHPAIGELLGGIPLYLHCATYLLRYSLFL